MPDAPDYFEQKLFVEYTYATSNSQLENNAEGEKLVIVPNTNEAAIHLPEGAQWKAASDTKTKSFKIGDVYTLVPSTSIPPGVKPVGSRWTYNFKTGHTFIERKGHCQRMGADTWPSLRRHLRSRLQHSEHPYRPCGGSGAQQGHLGTSGS